MSSQFPSPTQDCICRAFVRNPACRAHYGALAAGASAPTVGPAEPVKERDVRLGPETRNEQWEHVRETLNQLGLAVARIEKALDESIYVMESPSAQADYEAIMERAWAENKKMLDGLAALNTRLAMQIDLPSARFMAKAVDNRLRKLEKAVDATARIVARLAPASEAKRTTGVTSRRKGRKRA